MAHSTTDFSARRTSISRSIFWTALAVGAVIVFVALLLLPNIRSAREAARRNHCRNNLQQISSALREFQADNGELPPAFTTGENGDRLHSWRTLLLPYLEEQELYNSIDLTRPWNDAVNEAALQKMPSVYLCPSSPEETSRTHYHLVADADRKFLAGSEDEQSDRDSEDSLRHKPLIVEVPLGSGAIWMSAEDEMASLMKAIRTRERSFHANDGFHVLFADGRVEFVLPPDNETLTKLLSGQGLVD